MNRIGMQLGKKNKKILVVCPYPENKAAGQRLKYEQYLDDFRKEDYDVTVRPFMSEMLWSIAHKEGFLFQKAVYTLLGIVQRVILLFQLYKYDIVYLFMYVTPIGTSFFERLYRLFSKQIIYDLEDNRFINSNKETAGVAQKLRGVSKTKYLVTHADHVITSSPLLNEVCMQYNLAKKCTYISSSINTDKFVPANNYTNSKKIVIGWTGTFSTRPFLDLLIPVFIELKKICDFKLLVIGNFNYEFLEMDLEVIQWTAEKEVQDLQKIDIGVYPLPEDEWVGGKSGLKAIQYMAFGLPCVATNISTVKNFIHQGENGYLVNTKEEWVTTLKKLIDEPELRKAVGEKARLTVMQLFSHRVIKEQYLAVLNSL